MKTFNLILGIVIFSTLGWSQTDTTMSSEAAADSLVQEESLVEVTPIADSTEVVSEMTDSTLTLIQEDSLSFAIEDTLVVPEPEMVLMQMAPVSANIAGLINEGPVYYWSNDHLEGLGLEALEYIHILDPTPMAIKANDCMDIVCHLLATDSTGLDYVIVGSPDSAMYKVYYTETKVVVLEALPDDLAPALDAYLREQAGEEMMAVLPEQAMVADTIVQDIVLTDMAVAKVRIPALQIRRRNFRSMDELFTNPANLARDYAAKTSWNLFPDFKIGIRNSLLTPGWYKKWWTTGGHWDQSTKDEYLATLINEELVLNITPNFHTLFGFRIGRFGFNIAGKSHIKLVLPGSIPTTLIPVLPMQDWTLNEPIENGGIELETIPFVLKSTLSYAHPISTPYGDLKVGVGLNVYEAAGYVKMVSDNFTVTFTEDSVFASASGEGWATTAGASGHLDDPNLDNLDPMNTLSDPTVGIDLGLIMDLYELVNQEVEVQLSIRNIGAKYTWAGLTHEAWTFEQRMPVDDNLDTDSLENYQVTETIVLDSEENYEIDVPTVINVAAFYQPLPKVLIGAGLEKAFTDEVRFGFSPDLEFYYQINLFPTKLLDFSYYHQTKYGDPVHTFGTGLHLGMLDAGMTLSFFNGVNSGAKGIGFGLRSSLHF